MGYESITSGIVDHAFLANLYEGISGNGVLSGGALTGTGTDRVVSYTAFTAIINGIYVSVAGSSVTHAVGDATNPRMDLIECNSSGTVAIVAGTPTAESTSQTRPPLPALTSGSIALGAVYVPASASVILDANVFDRRTIVPTRPIVRYKTASQTWANDTFANVTATSGDMSQAVAANEDWLLEWFLLITPAAVSAGGGFKWQLTGPAVPTAVRIQCEYATTQQASSTDSIWLSVASAASATAFSSPFASAPTQTAANDGYYSRQQPFVVRAVIRNGANAGTVALQAAQSATNATVSTINGGIMVARRITIP